MFQLLVVFAVAFLIAVAPVMFAARLVGAGRHGFGASLLAVILQAILSVLLRSAALSPLLIIIVAILAGSAIYAYVLDTSMIRGFLLSIIATVISMLVILGLASLFEVAGVLPRQIRGQVIF